MSTNSRFAVAVHAVTALAYRAKRGDEWVSSATLAESVQTNAVVVRRVMAALAKAGIVESQAGRAGGTRLARTPDHIPLAEIYRAVEDRSVLVHNPNGPNRSCPVSCGMRRALTPVFSAVEAAVDDTLGATTLADILKRI